MSFSGCGPGSPDFTAEANIADENALKAEICQRLRRPNATFLFFKVINAYNEVRYEVEQDKAHAAP